ncbi:MAG TPA: GTPase domain-containing protein [Gemmatimonadales bacterium]|jgi:signal recognition particle receptor subunit beta
MARLDAERQELAATVVVYGPPKAGKTTILHCIRDRVTPERRGGFAPFGSDAGVAPLLDWLPLDLGTIAGWHARVDLYAIPDQRHADATRRLILADADGVLFAADSQAARLGDNVTALGSLRDNLDDRDGRPRDVPVVFLYTKADLPGELLLGETAMDRALNPRHNPVFSCSALRGEGVLEGLHAVITLLMRQLGPARKKGG